MEVAYFDTRVLRAAVNSPDLKVTERFFADTFFTNRSPVFGTTVDFEIVEGAGRRLARLRRSGQVANTVSQTGRKVVTVKLPIIREKKPFAAANLLRMGTLGTPYVGSSADIAKAKEAAINKELTDLKNGVLLREEWLCAQAMTGGWTYSDDDGVDYALDFGWDTSFKPTLLTTDKWDEPAATFTGNIERNLRDWTKTMKTATGSGPTKLILGSDAYEAFITRPEVLANLDRLNYQVGQLAIDVNSNRVGRYNGLEVYTYSFGYTDESGNPQDMLDPSAAILVGGNLNTEILYGLIEEESIVSADPFFSKSWVVEDPSVRWVLVSSAPLPVIYNAGSVIYATVV